MSAIIVPVGQVASNPRLLNVADHENHQRINDMVFWNVNLPGTREKEKQVRVAPWKYNHITEGYFSINQTNNDGTNRITHKFNIEYVKQIWELQSNLNAIEGYIPEFRHGFYDENHPDYSPNDYAILINEITPLNNEKRLDDFIVSKTNKTPKKNPRLYLIVEEL